MQIPAFRPQAMVAANPAPIQKNQPRLTHGLDQVHFSGRKPKASVSEQSKILFQLADLSYQGKLKWKPMTFEIPDSDWACEGNKTKLKDGREISLSKDFFDIEAGEGAYISVKEKGKKPVTTNFADLWDKEPQFGELHSLFNDVWMLRESWCGHPAAEDTDEDAEAKAQIDQRLADLKPIYGTEAK